MRLFLGVLALDFISSSVGCIHATVKAEFAFSFTFSVLYFQNLIKARFKDLFLLLGMTINNEDKHTIFCKRAFSNI